MKRFILALLLVVSYTSFAADIAPVKNEVPSKYTVTRQEVLWMYTMKTRFWTDGTRITVFYLPQDTAEHRNFCRSVLQIGTDQFNELVMSHINGGNASYFRQVNTVHEMYYKVSVTPGSIGYVDRRTVVINKLGYVNEIKLLD